MNYHDYMAQFALLDETKTVLMGRMKQRARQLRAAGARTAPRTASAEVSPKKNTFRLHPMRWAAVFMSIALVVTATPLLAIFVPWGNAHITEIKLDYMKDLMVDTEGVTAYSIRRETVEEPAESLTFTGKDEGPAISLLSAHPVKEGAELLADGTKTYQYLYSTTDRYEAGNVEYNETGIQKVTFMKNREVTEDVYDENGQLIGAERRIGQDELDAQINKMYTTDRFTFVQFVAKVEESGYYKYIDAEGKAQGEYIQLRPEGLHFDENGVSDFDKGYYVSMLTAGQIVLNPSVYGGEQYGIRVDMEARGGGCGYYSSAFSAAFVIDNETGYFYKIENLEIWGFRNGLVIDKNACVYTVDVDADRNLVFTDVVPNKDIVVYDVFSDGNGWVYVYNNTLDSVDRERKTAYTTKKYYFDAEGNVYFPQGETNVLTQRVVEGELVPFENQGYIRDLHTFDWRWGTRYSAERYLRGYCGNLAIYSLEGWNEHMVTWSGLVDDAYKEYIFVAGYMQAGNVADPVHGISLEFDQTVVTGQFVYKWTWRWLNDDYNVLLAITDGTLYYKEVDLTQYADRSVVLTEADFTQLSDRQLEPYDDYDMSVGNDFYKVEGVYRYKGLNETKYYRVVRTETGLGLEELTSKSYADNVFIFQPINK